MQKTVSGSFSLNIKVLRMIGLYPPETRKSLYKVYSYVLFILGLGPQTILSALHFAFLEDMTNIENNDFMTLAMIFCTYKFLPFVTNGERIKKCVEYFDELILTIRDQQQRTIIQECVEVCERNSKIFIYGCGLAWVSFMGQVGILHRFRELPYNLWLPRYVKDSPPLFYSSNFGAILSFTYAVLACSAVDPLVSGLLHHASAQLQVLENDLERVETFVRKNGVYAEVKRWIRRYQLIIGFIDQYQKCFSSIILSQFACSSGEIAFCCFSISQMSELSWQTLMMYNYLGLMFFQLFFYCYFGTMLIEENKNFATSLYKTRWYNFDLKSQKALNILMERSKRDMVVKAGAVLDLSLETFTMVLNKSYALLAVLNR